MNHIVTREERRIRRKEIRTYPLSLPGILIGRAKMDNQILAFKGKTLLFTSKKEVSFTLLDQPVPLYLAWGQCRIELQWPIRLDGKVPLKLVLTQMRIIRAIMSERTLSLRFHGHHLVTTKQPQARSLFVGRS